MPHCGAGDGLEYDLDDIIVLQYVHETKRHLLVPLYLELPLVRAQASASRIDPANRSLLPEPIRDAGWAITGCSLHASYFANAEASLDQEMRHWSTIKLDQSRRVDGILHERVKQAVVRHATLVHRAIARHAASGEPADQGSEGRAKQAGANIFGYFFPTLVLASRREAWQKRCRCCDVFKNSHCVRYNCGKTLG
jgi:hypothetical protein